MRSMHRAALLLAAALIAAPAALAYPHSAAGVEAARPWSRPAAAGANAAGFLVLANKTRHSLALAKVESPLAAKVEIHRSEMKGGMMSMAPVSKLEIAPGKAATFAPGGDHLMFVGLTRALKVGDRLPATLIFSDGQRLKVEFPVQIEAPAGSEPAHDPMGHSVTH